MNRRTTGGPKTSGTLRQQVKSLQKVVKRLAPEKKMVDVSLAQANIPNTGAVTHITAVGAGTGQNQRVGNTINVTDITCRGFLTGGTDVDIVSFMRFAIVVDKEQVADTQPTAANIFTSQQAVQAFPNLDNLERFRVLWMSSVYDMRMVSLDTDSTVPPTRSSVVQGSWKGNIKVSFNGTASTDMDKNNIYFVILKELGTETADFSGTARIAFTDV